MAHMTETLERALAAITFEILGDYHLFSSYLLNGNFTAGALENGEVCAGKYTKGNMDYDAIRNTANGLWYLTGDYTYNS